LKRAFLEDVLSPEPGGLFVAFIHGKRYNGEELYKIDPHVGRDQVQFHDLRREQVWRVGFVSMQTKSQKLGHPIRIGSSALDTTLGKNASLTGKAETPVHGSTRLV